MTVLRSSRTGRWRAAVLVGVHLLLAAHIAHWWITGVSLSPLEPSEAMELAKHSVINAGLVFFGASILLTAVFGRFFCGWGCHLVALQDGCRWLLARLGIRPRPFRSRLLGWVPAIAFTYMFLWPAAYRAWHGEALSPLSFAYTTSGFWDTFPGWTVALTTFAVCGFATVYFLGAKGFCTYACPYGAAFGAVDRLAPVSIRVTDACAGCGHCTATCTSNVRVHEEVATYGMVVSPGCMKTLDCVSVCPNDALYLGIGRPSLLARLQAWKRLRGENRAVAENRSRVPKPSRALNPSRASNAGSRRRAGLAWGEEILAAGAFLVTFVVIRGLYGLFPFLLSLGLGAIFAYLAVQGLRLWTRPHLRIRRWALKRHGRLLPAGWVFIVLAATTLGLLAHSALVRYHLHHGQRLYAEAAPLRALVEQGGPPSATSPLLGSHDRRLVRRGRRHLERVDRWGLRTHPGVRLEIAWLSLLEGDEESFEAYLESALNAAPDDSSMRAGIGDHFFRRERFDRAAAFYEAALEIDPAAAGAAINLGLLRARQGGLEEAAAIFSTALAAAPDIAQLHYNAALVDIGRGLPEAAVERFQRALEIDQGFLEARENLAGVLCGLGRFDEGIEQYRRAIEQSPGDPATQALLARAYAATGRDAEAQRALNEARRLAP